MLHNFTNQYQLSKTLRFELRPVGRTLEHIESKGLLAQDQERAEDYKEMKKIIDRYHKAFIEDALNDIAIEGLEEYEKLYFAVKDEKEKKAFEKLQDTLRKRIVEVFKKHPKWNMLFKKELIKNELLSFLDSEDIPEEQKLDEKATVVKFMNFTTYFTGFHENRANMYADEALHTAVAYRIIHENLPVFLSNKRIFEQIAQRYPELIDETKNAIEPYLLGAVFEDMFTLGYFSHTLSQTHIDLYNTMIGGKVSDDGAKVQGFNEKINLYRQKYGFSKRDLPNLKPLYKQILSDRESLSWLPEAFKDKSELTEAIITFYQNNIAAFECCDGKINLLEKFPEIFTENTYYDLSKIFIKNDKSLTNISQAIFGNYGIIKEALWEKYLKDNPKAAKSKDIAADEEKFFNKKDTYFSIDSIQTALKEAQNPSNLLSYFSKEIKPLTEAVQKTYVAWLGDQQKTEYIKELMDAFLAWQRFLKPLSVKSDIDRDIAFYATFESYFESLSAVVKLYDKIRNFMTKKPYSIEKFKLNFENSTLLDGWDVNKETDNSAVLLRKDGLYYLGIMDKKHTKVFKNISKSIHTNSYEKIDYKLLPGANKMLPKVFFSNKNIGYYRPGSTLLERYNAGNHKKGDNFDRDFCHELIDFFKVSIQKHEDWKHFGFNFSPTALYEDLSGFYREVEHQGYKITVKPLEAEFINTLVDEGKLYLFQIYNKDFSPYSKGMPNMHTLYWKMLFDERNLADVVYKLNGQAEIFYRQKSLDYSDEIMQKGHHVQELSGKFSYPIIKDRRFALDKFQFHVPITMNFKADGNINLNARTQELIRNNSDDIKIIGIDRGERHLLYLSLIDTNGCIVEQYSLNKIVNSYNNKEHKINYHEKLAKKEKERAEARVNWGTVENIKELKEGYMSHVIHRIATLIMEHNAIVILEDLNFGFKRGRFKVEKQVYQKFEKMLIDKLNYLVDKKKDADKLGGVLNALQLTNKFESFEKMGKQNGFLFYVPAWNTSKIDPVTGFVNLFDTRYASIEKAKEFFAKFKSIRYNGDKGYFEFEVDNYTQFNAKAEGTRQKWTICTYGDRVLTFRNSEKLNQWDNKIVNLTQGFKTFFGDIEGELKDYILAKDDKAFFEKLLGLFKLTLQMRNSVTGTEIDYLISPVADANGKFYDSRTVDAMLPKDADANGAYNIARKGLMMIEKIKNAEDMKKIDLKITNKEWLQFAQR